MPSSMLKAIAPHKPRSPRARLRKAASWASAASTPRVAAFVLALAHALPSSVVAAAPAS
eukprot:CAMPEP_0177211684 /NCGR_PEP_ID=MMETSP0367-20130122/32225_1 /TAXON_ID=447022 ORGANISM="Scrippsiella hangoei-like, Strain SHHI-4" /NCGR_SAMPLE_ID=MMETSP0367 /ASSEMBLY_ACC=CAM_ASM_000362 /LENGTH=58 /DNA_ID=CAMNT_0018660889 /DNA_START=121 /DNA_END=294 /DNA_ORIENTATION=+